MAKQISNHAAAAKLIRAELKKNGVNGKVRATASSIYVTLIDVTPTVADQVRAYASQYQYGRYDGMTDCYEMSNSRKDIPQVQFVIVQVEFSDSVKAAAWAFACDYYGLDDAPEDHKKAGSYRFEDRGIYGDSLIWEQLTSKRHPEFWRTLKPRVTLSALAA